MHSVDMVERNFFDHTNPDGLGPGERMSDVHPRMSFGENIGWGYQTAEQMMVGWLESYGHCTNLMQGFHTEIGATSRAPVRLLGPRSSGRARRWPPGSALRPALPGLGRLQYNDPDPPLGCCFTSRWTNPSFALWDEASGVMLRPLLPRSLWVGPWSRPGWRPPGRPPHRCKRRTAKWRSPERSADWR